jgi:hypothetical protein
MRRTAGGAFRAFFDGKSSVSASKVNTKFSLNELLNRNEQHIGNKCSKDAIFSQYSGHSSLKISHGCEVSLVKQATSGSVRPQN